MKVKVCLSLEEGVQGRVSILTSRSEEGRKGEGDRDELPSFSLVRHFALRFSLPLTS